MSYAMLQKCPFINLSVSEEFPISVVTEVSGGRVLSHGNHSWKKTHLSKPQNSQRLTWGDINRMK